MCQRGRGDWQNGDYLVFAWSGSLAAQFLASGDNAPHWTGSQLFPVTVTPGALPASDPAAHDCARGYEGATDKRRLCYCHEPPLPSAAHVSGIVEASASTAPAAEAQL
jgi:hypothetical protein